MCAQRTLFCGHPGMRTATLETGRNSQSLRHFCLLIMSELRSPRLTMSKADKAELYAIQLQALEYLQKLRSFEVSGTDVQVGPSTKAIQEGTGCANAHQTTLERLIALLFHYYRRIYGTEDLQETVLRLITSTPTPSDDPSDDATVEEIQEGSKDAFTAPVFDIRALEQMSVDMAVSQCYLDPRVTISLTGFLQIVPTLSEVYRMPLFASTAQEFYTLIVDSFDRHPAHAQVSWKTTETIREAYSTECIPVVYTFTGKGDAKPVVRSYSPRYAKP
jgi:hypothetical protein